MKDYSKMSLNDLAKEQAKLVYKECHTKRALRNKCDKLQEIGNELEKRMPGPCSPKQFLEALIAEKKSLIN